MAVAVSVVVTIAAVVVVVEDVPGRIVRALSGTASEPLFSAQRLDAELDVVRARLGELPMRRVDVTSNLISVEAVAADGQLHKYWVREGEVENVDSIADLHAGEKAFPAADLSGQRTRAAVADVRSIGKPGEIQLVSYIFPSEASAVGGRMNSARPGEFGVAFRPAGRVFRGARGVDRDRRAHLIVRWLLVLTRRRASIGRPCARQWSGVDNR